MSRKRRREQSIIISLVPEGKCLLESAFQFKLDEIEGNQIWNLRFLMDTLPKANMSKEADRNDCVTSHLQLGLLETDEEFQLPAEATYVYKWFRPQPF